MLVLVAGFGWAGFPDVQGAFNVNDEGKSLAHSNNGVVLSTASTGNQQKPMLITPKSVPNFPLARGLALCQCAPAV